MRVCPHCGATSSPTHLFCEDCGYDFTTGALPLSLSEGLAAIDTRVPVSAPPTAPMPATSEPATPESVRQAPATPEPAVPDTTGAPDVPPGFAATPDVPLDPPVAPDVRLDPPAAPVTGPRPTNQAPSRRAVGDWVVEVWIDPVWFEAQSSDEACPSPAVPDIVRISGRALVGRYSASRRIIPDVDCGTDSGVSRRHAEFTTDGRRWWVEDLGSSNGTFVGPASGPLPEEPIPAGQRVEIDDDDRIYVGAWTRLVLRRATASEIAGTG